VQVGPSKAGIVKHVLFAQYVTSNQLMGTMSYVDVLDGLNVQFFPLELRIFVIAIIRDSTGDFDYSLTVSQADGTQFEPSPPFHIPLQITKRFNIATPTPLIKLSGPTTLTITLLADKAPFHQELFEINQAQVAPAVASS
jgi:hypothetical protein